MRHIYIPDLPEIFTTQELAAIELLKARGFRLFTAAKLEDVREMDGRRRRTFRNSGRYDLILARRKADPDPDLPFRQTDQDKAGEIPLDDIKYQLKKDLEAEFDATIEKLKTEHRKELKVAVKAAMAGKETETKPRKGKTAKRSKDK